MGVNPSYKGVLLSIAITAISAIIIEMTRSKIDNSPISLFPIILMTAKTEKYIRTVRNTSENICSVTVIPSL
ncbi:hypothetical protein D3C73_568090 [compost metagenome]